jgi:osmotically-inducible protein OsmY
MAINFAFQPKCPRIRIALLISWAVMTMWVMDAFAANIKDGDIALAVDTQLVNDDGVPAHRIDVRTEKGIVSLSGSVPHLLARERAGEIATRVKGVRSVVNRLEIRPVPRTDDQIRKDVELALLADPATNFFGLKVGVRNGIVSLGGRVDSWQEERLCILVAKGVNGVRKVLSNIDVARPRHRSDDEIKAEIKRRLDFDVWVDAELVDVKVVKGQAFLSGMVGSLAEKKRAFGDAWIAGVKSVEDKELQVDWLKHSEMRRSRTYEPKSDAEIRQAIKDAFSYDPRISRFDPQIEVNNGVVTLIGRVDNLRAKKAAGQDARNTRGVWQVKNHLKIWPAGVGPSTKPEPDADAEVARTVRAALSRNPYVHQHEIAVTVNNYLVVLRGTVESAFEKEKATEAVLQVRGVADLINNLSVERAWTPKNDWEIKQDIESELWWSPFIDSEDIDISVADGVATLVGQVDTLRERRIATENAYEGGARSVSNHLKVRYGPAELRP